MVEEMRAWSRRQRADGCRIGLVPTMGFLHQGHLHLVDTIREHVDQLVVSVFVNPTQFGAGEDLERYPRDLDRDRDALGARSADCLFHPTEREMYPTPGMISVDPGALGRLLCGRTRPGHFAGVLTVVSKLLHIVQPDVAVFGRKDFQQSVLIERMVRDLDLPVEIITATTVREADGLAMSSRNRYLSDGQRRAAPTIARALDTARATFKNGERDATKLVDSARTKLAAQSEITVVYLDIVHPHTLTAMAVADASSVMAVAVHLGRTRLIDNIVLGSGTSSDVRLPA
jgi:pantoate--beta-alanine ligase